MASDASQGQSASVDAAVIPDPGEGRYRIALAHPDESHDNSTVFSWRRQYRFDPEFHPDDYDPLAAAKSDVRNAKKEFPGHDAWVEVLVDNGDGTSSWVAVEEKG